MDTTPWKTDKWFTSPWNFADEVKSTYHFNKNIKLHDISLRDGEQQAGLIFSKDEKVRLAEKMAEIGIHRIEAGMPAVSPDDKAAITQIVKMNLGPEIFAFCRCVKADVEKAADIGVSGIVIEIPSSDHMIEKAYKWDLEKTIDLSIEATSYAKEKGLYTVFFPIDMSRADMHWAMTLIKRVADEGHMDALAIVDTFGGLNPSAIPYLIKTVKSYIDKPIEVHFHDDFGLGSANTILGLAAGADVAHTTISAIGERAGNASYEEVALSLLTMYGVDLGLKYDKIYELSKMMCEMTGMQVRPNQGIIGDKIAEIESGIITGWYNNVKEHDPLELTPYLPELTGHPDNVIVLGKGSGLPSIEYYLKKTGFEIPPAEKCMDILNAVKATAIQKHGLVSEKKFVEITKKFLN
ncbi:2-isopropylmalate synthase [bioreactor metagenome]|uniref:2-isopropylmalate synthase n=1 Tax=bioreactor metagenome TaxID=1076179 RepID=A0A644WAC0_9ZZZZ